MIESLPQGGVSGDGLARRLCRADPLNAGQHGARRANVGLRVGFAPWTQEREGAVGPVVGQDAEGSGRV